MARLTAVDRFGNPLAGRTSPTGGSTGGTKQPTTLADARRLARQISKANGGIFTKSQIEDYAKALFEGQIKPERLRKVAEDALSVRRQNRKRVTIMARNLGLPAEYVDMFVKDFLDTGDVELSLTKIRESDAYEKFFPGNRREDGTVRYTEREYQMVVESYGATLEDYGLNPDLYASKFADMIAGDVSPDEFAARVDSVNARILQAPQEVREAFAAEFGLGTAMESAILGVALDPDIGNAVRERRMTVAEITGQGKRFGFNRSRQRVQELMEVGLTGEQAADLYSGAAPTLSRLGGSAAATGETFGIGDFEDAAVLRDGDALSTASRLSEQESSRYSRSTSSLADRSNALIGLRGR